MEEHMHEITTTFKKTAVSGYFYHSSEHDAGDLEFSKPPVAAKSGYRIKLWISTPHVLGTDIPIKINGVEEVAEHERGELFQIHTDIKTWEKIVGINLIQAQRERFAAGEARRREMWAQREREWDARQERDSCIETSWERNDEKRQWGGQAYIATAELPAWMGSAKIYLSEKMGSGGGPNLKLTGAPNPKQWITLRINNVWVSFFPGYKGSPHLAFVIPEDWDTIFNYEGGQLPDEPCPPRTRDEIRIAGKDLGFSSTESYEWVKEANEINGKVWGVALAYGQQCIFENNHCGLTERIAGYEAAINRYKNKILALDEELDATAIRKMRARQSEIIHKLNEARQAQDDYERKMNAMRSNYTEALARYKYLVARREHWEDGIHPDRLEETEQSDTLITDPTEID